MKTTMKTQVSQIAGLALLATALLVAPTITRAEDATNPPAAQAPAPKKHSLPFHGKVVSVDATAMTFTVKTQTFSMTSATKITKDGKPAVFSDITVGANVSGAYKIDDAGKLNATSVKVGPPKKQNTPAATPAPAPQ